MGEEMGGMCNTDRAGGRDSTEARLSDLEDGAAELDQRLYRVEQAMRAAAGAFDLDAA